MLDSFNTLDILYKLFDVKLAEIIQDNFMYYKFDPIDDEFLD